MATKVLETTQPNIGSGKEAYAHCPNCSKMFLAVDEDGHDETLPRECKRCHCPMVAGDESKAFMDLAAEAQHDEAVAAFGAQYRGETGARQSRTEMRAELRAEVEAEVRAEYKEKAKAAE